MSSKSRNHSFHPRTKKNRGGEFQAKQQQQHSARTRFARPFRRKPNHHFNHHSNNTQFIQDCDNEEQNSTNDNTNDNTNDSTTDINDDSNDTISESSSSSSSSSSVAASSSSFSSVSPPPDDGDMTAREDEKKRIGGRNGGWSLFCSPYFGDCRAADEGMYEPFKMVEMYRSRLAMVTSERDKLTSERDKMWAHVLELRSQLQSCQKHLLDAVTLIRTRLPSTTVSGQTLPTPIPLHPGTPIAALWNRPTTTTTTTTSTTTITTGKAPPPPPPPPLLSLGQSDGGGAAAAAAAAAIQNIMQDYQKYLDSICLPPNIFASSSTLQPDPKPKQINTKQPKKTTTFVLSSDAKPFEPKEAKDSKEADEMENNHLNHLPSDLFSS